MDRFSKVITVPGNRSFHQYTPLSESSVGAKRCSDDTQYALVHNLLHQHAHEPAVNLSEYVCCVYDGRWFVGMILAINAENDDVDVELMHSSGLSRSFAWPEREDIKTIPTPLLLCRITAPPTPTGRQYRLTELDTAHINQAHLKFSKSVKIKSK